MSSPGDAGTRSSDAVVSSIDITAPPDRVFNVLLDPTTYPKWLRGAKRIRAVDDAWPAPGAAFHHVVGVGPLSLADRTTVVAHDRPHRLELRAGARPTGVAQVVFTLMPAAAGTHLVIEERPCAGPARLVWDHGGRPLMTPGLRARNDDSLRLLQEHIERG